MHVVSGRETNAEISFGLRGVWSSMEGTFLSLLIHLMSVRV